MGDHRSAIDRRPVARNDLRVRTGVTDHDAETINQPLQRSAVGAIDVRVLNRSIEVAGHDHVEAREDHQRVAVGVRARDGDHLNLLAVHAHHQPIAIRHLRQAGRRHRRAGRAVRVGIGVRQAVAQLLARDDDGAHLAEVLVAAGVIAVHVGVDDELDRLRRQALDRGGDLVAERRELRVDHEYAIRAEQHADRPALAVERVELVGDLVGLDLDLAEVRRALGVRRRGAHHQCSQEHCNSGSSHDVPP